MTYTTMQYTPTIFLDILSIALSLLQVTNKLSELSFWINAITNSHRSLRSLIRCIKGYIISFIYGPYSGLFVGQSL